MLTIRDYLRHRNLDAEQISAGDIEDQTFGTGQLVDVMETGRCSYVTQAGMPNKRLAQSKLVRMVLNKGEALA